MSLGPGWQTLAQGLGEGSFGQADESDVITVLALSDVGEDRLVSDELLPVS